VADFVKCQRDDETEVLFESAEAELMSIPTGDAPDIAGCRQLSGRHALVAKTASQVAETIRTDGDMMRSP
jgi:hypothetical protein